MHQQLARLATPCPPAIAGHTAAPYKAAFSTEQACSVPGLKVRLLGGAAAAAALVLAAPPALAVGEGASLFARNCAGCHAGGGNVVNGAKTLRTSDLERYSVDPDAMYKIVYGGQGKMPGYGADCAPKGACTFGTRLSDGDIKTTVTYVLDEAKAGWPAPAN